MSRFHALVVIVFLLAFCGQLGYAASSGAATLQNFTGGRAGGMADAFSTVGDDVTVWNYNPATLTTLKGAQLTSNFSMGYAKDYFSVITYGIPTRLGTFAGSFGYYDTGTEELFAPDGSAFNVHLQQDLLGAFSYATRTGMVSIGATGKFLRSKLAETVSATSYAADFGILMTPYKDVSIGASVRNIGGGIKYIEEEDPLPLEFRLGGSYTVPLAAAGSRIIIAADIPYLKSESLALPKIGVEYAYHENLSLQAGYHFNSDSQNATFGIGLIWEKVIFNYAFGLTDGLGNIHRITLGYHFGQAVGNPKPAPKPRPETAPVVAPKAKPPQQIKDLEDSSWEKRRDAAQALGELKDPQAVEPLTMALLDENPQVSGTAARALGKIGDNRAFDPLVAALSDLTPYIRASAAWGLGELGDKRAIDPLTKMLKDKHAGVVKITKEALERLE